MGSAVAALVLAFRIHHMDLRRITLWGLVTMIVCDGLSIGAAIIPVEVLAGLRFVSGGAAAAVSRAGVCAKR